MKKILISALFFLAGCSTFPRPDNMEFRGLKTDDFKLATWERESQKGKPLHIYIEGDGYAWRTPYLPSSDPTPRRQMLLKLAQKDYAANVVYLARPCQYVWTQDKCDVPYWTDARYAPEVVSAMQDAAQYYINKTKTTDVTLIGYSGGATVAAALSVRLPHVKKLITVAGVLDQRAWTAYHDDSPLTRSIDADSYRKQIAAVPQRHYAGAKDDVVPPVLIQNFVDSLQNPADAMVVILPDATHAKGWTPARLNFMKEE